MTIYRSTVMKCNICRLPKNALIRLGRDLYCECCLNSVARFINIKNNDNYAIDSADFEMIYSADMSLRIFRETFPNICNKQGFQHQLKHLEKNIKKLETVINMNVSNKPNNKSVKVFNILKTINDELKVLHKVYNE